MNGQSVRTKEEAFSKGYADARHGIIERYRHFEVFSFDISGANEIGCRFEIRLSTQLLGRVAYCEDLDPVELAMYRVAQQIPFLARSVTVWMREEKNLIGELGAFSVMYPPGSVDAAIGRARQAIDQFYCDNPDFLAREQRLADEAAAADARQQAKNVKRAKKLAQKYGKSNLREPWASMLA